MQVGQNLEYPLNLKNKYHSMENHNYHFIIGQLILNSLSSFAVVALLPSKVFKQSMPNMFFAKLDSHPFSWWPFSNRWLPKQVSDQMFWLQFEKIRSGKRLVMNLTLNSSINPLCFQSSTSFVHHIHYPHFAHS